ncbi:MAG: SPOR domain-containing protein [Phycisphaerales bacterium]|nr:SPOR domain-containing protein [Phycisphaerales bacterium]
MIVHQPLTLVRSVGPLLGLILAMWAIWIGGCSAGSGSGQATYREQYEAGMYRQALASAQARAGRPGASSEAALVAGLSAEALRDDATAKRWLEPVARGTGDRAARARAGLALIERRTGDPLRAARDLEIVSAQLGGQDAREAARVSATAYERAGRPTDAERMRRRAVGAMPAGSRTSAGFVATGYTLQVGAYSTRSRANQRVAEVGSAVRSAGLGPARVELASRDGPVLYLVHVGRFSTFDDAERARRTLGVSTIVAEAL